MLLTYISSASLPTRDVDNENSASAFVGVTAKIWAVGVAFLRANLGYIALQRVEAGPVYSVTFPFRSR
jgi:hypothetical protein